MNNHHHHHHRHHHHHHHHHRQHSHPHPHPHPHHRHHHLFVTQIIPKDINNTPAKSGEESSKRNHQGLTEATSESGSLCFQTYHWFVFIYLINPQLKYRRVVRENNDELVLRDENRKVMQDNQGTMRATASGLVSSETPRLHPVYRLNSIPTNKIGCKTVY